MTSLLTHTVAHSNRPTFRSKTNSHPIKKFCDFGILLQYFQFLLLLMPKSIDHQTPLEGGWWANHQAMQQYTQPGQQKAYYTYKIEHAILVKMLSMDRLVRTKEFHYLRSIELQKSAFFVHCSVSECLANQQATVLKLSHSVAVFELNRTIWQDFIEFL